MKFAYEVWRVVEEKYSLEMESGHKPTKREVRLAANRVSDPYSVRVVAQSIQPVKAT